MADSRGPAESDAVDHFLSSGTEQAFSELFAIVYPQVLRYFSLEFAVPWLFALAASYRSGIAVHGAAQIPRSSPVSPYLEQTFRTVTRIS